MTGLLLYWITSSLVRKNNLISKEEIKETNKKLAKAVRWLNIKIIIKNNFDIKPVILKLFYFSLIINMLMLGLAGTAAFLYTGPFFSDFLGAEVSDLGKANWPWIGLLIINILYIFFIIRMISDYYKLSLRGKYRNNYQKLLFLDIFTLNIFSVIATLIFIKKKWQMIQSDGGFPTNNNVNSKLIKNYFQIIAKVEIFIFLINLLIFVLALVAGYFVQNNNIKVICLICIIWNLFLLYAWSIPRIIAMSIIKKMFKNLLNNNSYHYLLTTIRFLPFIFGAYYSAILITLLKLDENLKEFVLENW